MNKKKRVLSLLLSISMLCALIIEPASGAGNPVDNALDQYRTIISQASSYQYFPGGYEGGIEGYRYTLVQMHTGDTVPTLLLEQETDDFMYYMRIFKYDPDTGTVHQPENVLLMEGMGGSYRGSIGMMEDGNGIRTSELSSGSGAMQISRTTLNGDTLNTVKQWEGRLGDDIPKGLGLISIDWHDIDDMSAFDAWTSDTDKNIDDMMISDIIASFPVKDTYHSTSDTELITNITEVYMLYNACNAIAEKVNLLSVGEYSLIASDIDIYLMSVENAYASLNVSDFPSVEQSEEYINLRAHRENVNARIALEPPGIIKVENIYPASDFSVEVHAMYVATTDRAYSLKFSNLTSSTDISEKQGNIPAKSTTDSVTLTADKCKSEDTVEIDVVYNGVNCRDTSGCSFTGSVMDPEKMSDWAKNEVNAAITLGLVPEELQKNYTGPISRRGFCLLAAAAIELRTKQDINSYALKNGSENITFSDTKEQEIMSSARLGIVSGYEDGTFKPQADITREQAAAMLSRCAKLLGMGYGSAYGTFSDSNLISAWAADSVAFVRSNEIMSGDTDNNFMPQGGYTVEQAIATFYRMYNKL